MRPLSLFPGPPPLIFRIQKLQELIRRGTPKDLAAAQELMKVMSGAVRPPSLSRITPPDDAH